MNFQMPTIEKIRHIIKSQQENGHISSKSSDDDSFHKNEEDKPMSEEEILESLGLKNVARTANGKIDHAKLSMKDRMAIVRGMRKRRRKGGLGLAASTAKKSGSPTPEEIETNNEDSAAASAEAEKLNEGQYKAFVTEIEKFESTSPTQDDSDNNEVEVRFAILGTYF